MNIQRYKPLVDKLFWIISVPTTVLLIGVTLAVCFFPAPLALFITILTDLIVIYFLIAPLFGYVELREDSVYIKYGLFLNKEIPYRKIRKIEKERRFYSDSMLSLKNAFDHINIKYNTFDITSVSVVNNDIFIENLNKRILCS